MPKAEIGDPDIVSVGGRMECPYCDKIVKFDENGKLLSHDWGENLCSGSGKGHDELARECCSRCHIEGYLQPLYEVTEVGHEEDSMIYCPGCTLAAIAENFIEDTSAAHSVVTIAPVGNRVISAKEAERAAAHHKKKS